MYIKSIKKDYGKTIRIVNYNRGVVIDPPRCKDHDQIACQLCWKRVVNPIPKPSSLQRSKTKITDYTLANDFDLFCTFTFNPELVDSFNIQEAKDKMSKWLNNSRRNSPDLKYLIVAELHKSGRIHFHALMKNYRGELQPTQRSKNGRKIYNLLKWRYGFSTAIEIDNIGKVSSYMQKYVTKDMIKIGNKKRFWASKNLTKPVVDYNVNMVEEVFSRPLFVTGIAQMEYYKVYSILKTAGVEKQPPTINDPSKSDRRARRGDHSRELSDEWKKVLANW